MTFAPATPAAASGLISFDHVSKSFRGADRAKEAVRDVALDIGPDESVGIIGPNGAGKSTLMRLAAGVTAPTSGRIVRSGRTMAVIELGAGIHPDLTGRENIELLVTLATGRSVTRPGLFRAIVEFAEIGDVTDRPARHYSTGMVARLAFSVAVHTEPELLLVDEVLSVGDLSFQERCRDRVFEMRAQGVTVVVVSHDLGLIGDVCDRTVLLVDGSVELDGPTDAIVRRYLGQPERPVGDATLGLRLRQATVAAGTPIEIEVEVPGGGAAVLRLDLVVASHPTFLSAGQDLSVVFGTARISGVTSGSVAVDLGTSGLPPGRFEVHATVEDEDGNMICADRVPVTLTGGPGPFAIRLESRASLDGRNLGPGGSWRVGGSR